MREHREGDVPVPAGVLADLVVVQACFSFAGLKGLLDGPPCTGGPGQVGEGYSFGSVGQVVGDVGRVGEAASGCVLSTFFRPFEH